MPPRIVWSARSAYSFTHHPEVIVAGASLIYIPLSRYPNSTMIKRNNRLRDMRSRGLAVIGMALVLGVLVAIVSAPAFAVVVDFPDPGLEAAIRDATGESTKDIHDTDLSGLTSLDARFRGITNLEGIQHCTALTELKLYGNEIIDISALSGLLNLTILNLDNNQIHDIGALSNLTNLEMLTLSNNKIVDISALSGLTHLVSLLSLSKNEIVDISALSNLTHLTRLDLVNNRIIDISALSGLTNLTGLGLGNNKIVDISAVSGLTNLAKIWLHDNQIRDIQALVDNSTLAAGDSVDIRHNYLDLTPGSPDMLNIETLQGREVLVDVDPQTLDHIVESDSIVGMNWWLLGMGLIGVILAALLLF